MKNIFFAMLAVMFVSCQTSKITYIWTAENISPKKYNKILVLGFMTDNDRELQAKMENHITADLNEMGLSAFSANQLFAPGTFVKGDTARAIEAINSKGFDAVLTIVLLNKVKEKYYIPGRVEYTPFATYYNRFGRYYYTLYDRIYTEGYYTTDTKIFWESNFYDVMEKKMVYSAQTQSFDPGSRESLAHYYGLLITNNLVKKKVLPEPVPPK
jgi:hypothetical protein